MTRTSVANMTNKEANNCPMNFFLGEMTNKSSFNPKNSSKIYAPMTVSNLIKSAFIKSTNMLNKIKTNENEINIPTPPKVGVFLVCELRSTGSSIKFFLCDK